jgi:hypothetical protein
MNAALQSEVQRLMGIARMHALTAMARPADQRESCLARYRLVWAQYAAAFSGSDAERESFVDALDRATREIMAQIESSDIAIWRAETDKWIAQTLLPQTLAGVTELRHRPGDVISLEQLRPILRKIIGR